MLVLTSEQAFRVFPELYDSGCQLAIDGNDLIWLKLVCLVKGKTVETKKSVEEYNLILKRIEELETKEKSELNTYNEDLKATEWWGDTEVSGVQGFLKVLWRNLHHQESWRESKQKIRKDAMEKCPLKNHLDTVRSELSQAYDRRNHFQHTYQTVGEREGYKTVKSMSLKTSEMDENIGMTMEELEWMSEPQCQRLNTFLHDDPSSDITEEFAQHQLLLKGNKKIIITPQGRHFADGTTIEEYLRTPWK